MTQAAIKIAYTPSIIKRLSRARLPFTPSRVPENCQLQYPVKNRSPPPAATQ